MKVDNDLINKQLLGFQKEYPKETAMVMHAHTHQINIYILIMKQ